MRKEELIKFINDNQGPYLIDFYNKAYDKLKSLNQRIDKLSLYLLVLVFIYFISSKSAISSFSIGPISMSDISLITILIPLLFSWVLLDLVMTSSQKSELFTTVKFLFLNIYKQPFTSKDLEVGRFNAFTRIILPFSYSSEISKFSSGKISLSMGCLGIIIFLPILFVLLLPIYFEYYMLKEIYNNHFNLTISKISFYLSIWLILVTIYYMVNNARLSIKEMRETKS